MEGKVYLGSDNCLLRLEDGRSVKIVPNNTRDARYFAHQILEQLGESGVCDFLVGRRPDEGSYPAES